MIDERSKPDALTAAVPRRGPVYSEPFDFGKGRRWRFRLLDNLETMWAIAYAEKLVLEQLREVFTGEDQDMIVGLMREHGPNHDLQTFWTELLALQAALCNEDGTAVVEGDAEDRGRQLADDLSPIERHELARMYTDFAEEHDPTAFSDADLERIIAEGKKNPGPSYWRQFGSSTLRRCMATMATDLGSAMRRVEELEAQVAQPTTADV